MPSKDRTDPFGQLLTVSLLGARVGFAAGFGVTAAELAAEFAPLGWQAPMFAIVGGTSTTIFWWIGRRTVQANNRGKTESKSAKPAAINSVRQIPYRYFYHSDILRLAATIFDWSDRMYFWHSVVDNDYLHRVTPDGQLVLRIRATSDNADFTQILDLERASGYTCAEVKPLPSDQMAVSTQRDARSATSDDPFV